MGRLRTSVIIVSLAAAYAAAAPGQKALSGVISGSFPAADYTVSGNALVPHRRTVSFEAGSILRFENFSGITVHGTFICKGTPSRPVIFTSVNDEPRSGIMPEPFDWNGVKVAPDAVTILLEHCIITYSTLGINIESAATPAVLTNVSFHHNGSASLTRERRMVPVKENIPFSCRWPDAGTESAAALKQGPKAGMTPPSNRAAPVANWKKQARISGAGIGIAGAALWLTGFLCAEHYGGLINPETPSAKARDYKESWNTWVAIRNSGIGIFCLGAAGFAVTLAF